MTTLEFRAGTIDQVIYRAVVEQNEYRVPEHLAADDLIVDIGAHIGCFSWLCWQRGARLIEAYEADPVNAACLQQNLQDTGVQVVQKAVWRSDGAAPQTLYHSGYEMMSPDGPDPVGMNTAAGHVLAAEGLPIATVSLDQILGDRQVRLLKIDCEGSEFPILLTSQKLRQVACIVGEYHVMTEIPAIAQVGNHQHYTPGILVDLFTALRFQVEVIPHPDARFSQTLGSFFAYRLD